MDGTRRERAQEALWNTRVRNNFRHPPRKAGAMMSVLCPAAPSSPPQPLLQLPLSAFPSPAFPRTDSPLQHLPAKLSPCSLMMFRRR